MGQRPSTAAVKHATKSAIIDHYNLILGNELSSGLPYDLQVTVICVAFCKTLLVEI